MFGGRSTGGAGNKKTDLRAGSSTNAGVERTMTLKELGNESFKRKEFAEAVGFYRCALHSLDDSGVDNEAGPLALRCTLLANRAACLVQLKQYDDCLKDCNEALALDSSLVKARYRRGLAYEGLGRYKEALEDIGKVKAADPSRAVAEAHGRLVLRDMVGKLSSPWKPETLARAASGSLPPRELMFVSITVGYALEEAARAARLGRVPSASLLRVLGLFSGVENVDFARAKCLQLVWDSEMRGPEASGTPLHDEWFASPTGLDGGTSFFDTYVLGHRSVRDTVWGRYLRLRGGLPGMRNSTIPGQREIKEVLPAIPQPSATDRIGAEEEAAAAAAAAAAGDKVSTAAAAAGKRALTLEEELRLLEAAAAAKR